MFWWTHRYLEGPTPNFGQMYSAAYWALRVVEQAVIFAVPAFLFVSGFFAASAVRRDQATVGWAFVRHRLAYLLVPYLLWSAVTVLGTLLEGERYTAGRLLRVFLLGQAAPPFYFVILLCQLYVLAPVMVLAARRQPWALLAVSGLLALAAHGITYAHLLGGEAGWGARLSALVPGWFFPAKLVWFALGSVYGCHQQRLRPVLARWRWAWLGTALALLMVGIAEWEGLLAASGQTWLAPTDTLVDSLYSGAILLGFASLQAAVLPLARPVTDLGSKSFGLYLTHYLVLTYAARATYHLAPELLGHQFIWQPLLIAAGIGLPLAMMAVARRLPPKRLYAYSFG